MKTGTVPSSWFGVTGTWSADRLLELLEEVNRRHIDHADLATVKAVSEELERRRKRQARSRRALLAFAALGLSVARADTIGILSNPGVDYPPTSTTGYPVGFISNPVYLPLGNGQNLNTVSIGGNVYVAIELDQPEVVLPAAPVEPTLPVLPPVVVQPMEPVPHHHIPLEPAPHDQHHTETPEPGSWVMAALGIILVAVRRIGK